MNAIMIIGTLLCCAAVLVTFGGIIADSNTICGIAAGTLVIGFIMVLGGGIAMEKEPKPQLYPSTAIVVSVDRENDVVTCVDGNGEKWEFTEADDWLVGDLVSMLMNDKGTPSIYDDEIVSVRYSRLAIIED